MTRSSIKSTLQRPFPVLLLKIAAIAGVAAGSAYATVRAKNASDDEQRDELQTRVTVIERVQDEKWKDLFNRLDRVDGSIDRLDHTITEILLRPRSAGAQPEKQAWQSR